jgi:hypothetical protein
MAFIPNFDRNPAFSALSAFSPRQNADNAENATQIPDNL